MFVDSKVKKSMAEISLGMSLQMAFVSSHTEFEKNTSKSS